MTIIHLIRHGETVWNAQHRLQGQADIPLSEKGRAQVTAQRRRMNGNALHVVSSDLSRARETARLLGFNDAIQDVRLREINVGSWEGLPVEEIVAQYGTDYLDWRYGRFTPPDGETWTVFCKRIEAALLDHTQTASEQSKEALIVCHGGVIRGIMAHVLKLPIDRFEPALPLSKTTMIMGERCSLLSYNWVA